MSLGFNSFEAIVFITPAYKRSSNCAFNYLVSRLSTTTPASKSTEINLLPHLPTTTSKCLADGLLNLLNRSFEWVSIPGSYLGRDGVLMNVGRRTPLRFHAY